jgi:hypothetical protein
MFMVEGVVSLFLLASIGWSLYFLREIVSAFGGLTPFRKLTKLLCHAFLWTTKTISSQFGDFNTPAWAERALSYVTRFCLCFNAVIWFFANPTSVLFAKYFGAHILIFIAAAVACTIVAFYFLGFLFQLCGLKDAKLGLVVFILCVIFNVSTSVFYRVATYIGIVLCIRQAPPIVPGFGWPFP